MAVKLFSKLDYAVTIPYGKSKIMIPPYARELTVMNEKALGELPHGIQIVKIKAKEKGEA